MDQQPELRQDLTGVSWTAVGAAASRAVESRREDRLFNDPFAADFVAAAVPESPPLDSLSAQQSDGFWAWFIHYGPIRTRFFDDYLLRACASGCRQVVLLAAGLDTRAFRLAWPEGVRLFELDLPEILTFKEQVLAGRGADPACRRVVGTADLRQDWSTALLRTGFRREEPTAWLAEGLLIYLTQQERDGLLETIGALSAPGSRLAFEYLSRTGFDRTVQAFENSPELEFLKTLWRSGGSDNAPIWLSRHGWQAQGHNVLELARSYDRPLPIRDPTAAATSQEGEKGLIIAQRAPVLEVQPP